MCQEVCAVKYVLKSKNKELLQNQSDLDPDIITDLKNILGKKINEKIFFRF